MCASGCGQALELMKVSSVHLAVARETLCTRTTASAAAHSPHLPTAPHASTRTPLRALASNTSQRRGLDSSWDREFLLIHSAKRAEWSSTNPTVFCLSQCALAIARVISVANGEKQRPQPVLQRNGASLEETNHRKSLTSLSHQDVVLRHCRRPSCERSCIFACCPLKPLR